MHIPVSAFLSSFQPCRRCLRQDVGSFLWMLQLVVVRGQLNQCFSALARIRELRDHACCTCGDGGRWWCPVVLAVAGPPVSNRGVPAGWSEAATGPPVSNRGVPGGWLEAAASLGTRGSWLQGGHMGAAQTRVLAAAAQSAAGAFRQRGRPTQPRRLGMGCWLALGRGRPGSGGPQLQHARGSRAS